jgi:hypothetical protein
MISHASAALLIARAIPAGLRLRLCFCWLRIGPHASGYLLKSLSAE